MYRGWWHRRRTIEKLCGHRRLAGGYKQLVSALEKGCVGLAVSERLAHADATKGLLNEAALECLLPAAARRALEVIDARGARYAPATRGVLNDLLDHCTE